MTLVLSTIFSYLSFYKLFHNELTGRIPVDQGRRARVRKRQLRRLARPPRGIEQQHKKVSPVTRQRKNGMPCKKCALSPPQSTRVSAEENHVSLPAVYLLSHQV